MNSLVDTKPASLLGLKIVLERRQLLSFFIMASLFSWIILIPYILSKWNIIPNTKAFEVFFALYPFVCPALASYIMHRTIGGKEVWQNVRKT